MPENKTASKVGGKIAKTVRIELETNWLNFLSFPFIIVHFASWISFGNKENKVAFMKDYLKQAEAKGVDVKNIAVDKSLSGYIKNIGKICKNTVVGFVKCYYVEDTATEYVANKIIAKASKSLSVFMECQRCS